MEEIVTTVTEYSVTTAALAKLKTELSGKKYAVDNATGMALAKFDRRGLVSLRTDLEKKRIEIKAPALERCKLIDSEANRIKAELLVLEAPIDEQIKVEEARKEEEKAEKTRQAAIVQQALDDKIAAITKLPLKCVNMDAGEITLFLATLEAKEIGGEFTGETRVRAETAKTETITEIRNILARVIEAKEKADALNAALEAETARIEAERVEAEQLAVIERERMAAQQAELDEQKRLQDIENEKALLLKNIQVQIDYLNSLPIDAFNNSLDCDQIAALLTELDVYECAGHAAVIVALEFNINRLQSLFDRVKADADARKATEESERVASEKQAAIDAENKRIKDEADAAQRETERQTAIVSEQNRVTAEKERKAAEKARKLAEAKFKDVNTALQAIQDICADDRVSDSEARAKIALIAEGNINA